MVCEKNEKNELADRNHYILVASTPMVCFSEISKRSISGALEDLPSLYHHSRTVSFMN